MTPAFPRKLLANLLAGRTTWRGRGADVRLKACVFKLDGIGDFVLALGAIRQIVAHYGEDQCGLVVSASSTELARREFPVATVFGFKQYMGGAKSILKLYFGQAALIKRYSFDTLISLRYQRTTFHHLALSWIHARRSIGLENSAGFRESDRRIYEFQFTEMHPAPTQTQPGFCLELERHRTILQNVLKQQIGLPAILPSFSSFASTPGSDLILTPFGGHRMRDFSEIKWLEVMKEVSRFLTVPIRLCGAAGDQPRLKRLGSMLQAGGIRNIAVYPPCSLTEFAQKVASCKAVLTVETSSAHLAAAFDKPAVVLIGGGHYGQFGPWQRSPKQRWLTRELPCFGCDWRCIFPEVRCITEISPSSVARAVVEVCREAG